MHNFPRTYSAEIFYVSNNFVVILTGILSVLTPVIEINEILIAIFLYYLFDNKLNYSIKVTIGLLILNFINLTGGLYNDFIASSNDYPGFLNLNF